MMKYLINYSDDVKVNSNVNNTSQTGENKVNQQTGGQSVNNNSIYLFKTNWCGHCQKFGNIWDKLKVSEKYKNLNFIEYDGDQDKSLFEKWNVTGIPTVIFRNGNDAVEHKGVKTFESMKDFIDKFNKPNKEGFNNSQTGGSNVNNNNKTKVTLYKAEWCGHCNQFKPEWEKLKNKYTKVDYQTLDADENSSEIPNTIKGFPTIMIEQNGNEQEYVGQRKADAIESFLEKNYKQFDDIELQTGGRSSKQLNEKNNKKIILFKSNRCPHCRAFTSEWNKLQENFKDIEYETFDNEKHPKELKKWDIDGVPTLMYINGKEATEYVGERSAKAIKKFVRNN